MPPQTLPHEVCGHLKGVDAKIVREELLLLQRPMGGLSVLQVRPLRQSTPSVKGPLQGRVSKDVNILKEAGRGCPGNGEDRVMKNE